MFVFRRTVSSIFIMFLGVSLGVFIHTIDKIIIALAKLDPPEVGKGPRESAH